jgi:hypothetical protein
MADIDRFDEYKFFAESTQNLAGRRQAATEVYLGVNTAVFALIAFLLKDAGLEGRLGLLALPLFVVGGLACLTWHRLLCHYRMLIGWRYDQLMAMEEALPQSHRMFSRERDELFQPQPGRPAFGFSQFETWLPKAILLLYVLYGGAFVIAKTLGTAMFG